MKALTRGLVWFKSTDLRLSDHLPYINARQTCEHTRHVYVFNPIEFGFGSKGYVKSSNLKLKFLLECVNDVSQSLRQLGHELELFIGNPENLIHQYAKQHGIEKIFTYNEIADEEVQTLHKTIRVTSILYHHD
jgi:deoxyribodipyrimidine photolyase